MTILQDSSIVPTLFETFCTKLTPEALEVSIQMGSSSCEACDDQRCTDGSLTAVFSGCHGRGWVEEESPKQGFILNIAD